MTEELPPLADWVALRSGDAARLEAFARAVAEDHEVHRPAPGWVVAVRSLPGSADVAEPLAADGLFVAEGADRLGPGGVARVDGVLDDPADDAVARLDGDVTWLRVRPDGSAYVARSAGGLVPVYVWEDGDDVVLSTTATALATRAGWRGDPDPLVTALWFSGWPTMVPGRSHLEGVVLLLKGERWDTARGRRRWWRAPAGRAPYPTAGIERAHQERLRDALVGELDRQLTRTGRNQLTLSGGVDSSVLLALSAGTLGRPVETFSFVPPADAAGHARDLAVLERLWAAYDVPHVAREIDPAARPEPAAVTERLLFPVVNPSTAGLDAFASPPDVLFGGELADEVVGSRNFTLPDLAVIPRSHAVRAAAARRLPRARRALGAIGKGTAPSRTPTPWPNGFPEWLQPSLRRDLEAADRAMREESGLDQPSTLWLRIVHLDWQAMQWEVCSALGVRRVSPFSTRAVLELALECHPLELLGPEDKRLMRGALRDVVPADLLERPDKGGLGRRAVQPSTVAPLPPAVKADLEAEPWSRIVVAGVSDDAQIQRLRSVVTRYTRRYSSLT